MMRSFYLPLILLIVGGVTASEWIETTQEDFRDGECECNLYASHKGGGAVEFVPHFDFNDDGYLDLFVADGDAYFYWGSPQGFSEDNRLILPHGFGGCSGADLNGDGFTDLVLSPCKDGNNYIFWGSSKGFSEDNVTYLGGISDANESNFIADFNKDGYLDIAASADYDHGSIYWGSEGGYSTDNRTDLPAYVVSLNIEVADFNKDGWLDVVFPNPWGGNQYIYFGSSNGFDSTNRTILQYPPSGDISPHGCSVADLNRDGWLDIVFTGYQTITQAQIFWGSPQGFKQSNSQLLDMGASAFGGSYIIDFNKDGYLDVVVFRNNNVSPLIFWGSSTGYSSSNASEIGSPLNAASGGCVADYNQDGEWDVFVLDFSGTSELFWGPDYIAQDIPPSGHHGQTREIGNVYDRSYKEYYTSSVFDAGSKVDWCCIRWSASTPKGSNVKLQLRSGNSPKPDNSWTDWVDMVNNGVIPESLNARYLQYRAIFTYTNPAYLPALYEVRVSYEPYKACITLEPDQEGFTKPEVPKIYDLWVINNGDKEDVVDLTVESNLPGWGCKLYDSTGAPLKDTDNDGQIDTGPIGSDKKVKIKVKITPPETAMEGDVDTTVIRGYSSFDPLQTDIAILSTHIRLRGEVCVIIEPDQSDYIKPKESKIYDLWVINAGMYEDVIDISIKRDSPPWNVKVYDSTGVELKDSDFDSIPDVGRIEPFGGKRKIMVEVIPPDTTVIGDSNITVIEASSSLDTTQIDTAVLFTRIEAEKLADISLEPDQSDSTSPGVPIIYDVSVINYGDYEDVVDLVIEKNLPDWKVELYDSSMTDTLQDTDLDGIIDTGPIEPDSGTIDIKVRVTPPANVASNDIDVTEIKGISSVDTTESDVVILFTKLITKGGGILLEPDQTISIQPGITRLCDIQVINLTGSEDTVNLLLENVPEDWRIELYDSAGIDTLLDSNNDGIPDTGPIGAGNSKKIKIKFIAPLTAEIGKDTLIVRGYSLNTKMSDTVCIILNVEIGKGIVIEPTQSGVVSAGFEKSYTLRVINRGEDWKVVNVEAFGKWRSEIFDSTGTELLEDSNGDGKPDIDSLGPGESRSIIVKITSPKEQIDWTSGESIPEDAVDTTIVYASSASIPAIKDSALLVTTLRPALSIHNYENPFREKTNFVFSLPEEGRVVLRVYSQAGELINTVINKEFEMGRHIIEWEAKDEKGKWLSPGVYIYLFKFQDRSIAKRLVVLPKRRR